MEYELLNRQESETDILYTLHIPLDETNVPFCPRCGVVDELYGHGPRWARFHDIPHLGKYVTLQIRVQRFRCGACKKAFPQELSEVNQKRKMTNRLVDWISKQVLKPSTFTDVAREVGVNEKTVRNIFADEVAWREDLREVITPPLLGIDETQLDGELRTVLVNLRDGTLFDMLPTDDTVYVTRYLSSMPDREKVQVVAMDMDRGFYRAVRTALPDATIVIDRFHIVRRANDALENVRKDIRKTLENSRQRSAMVGDRKLLLMRRHRLEAEVDPMVRMRKVDSWFSRYPLLKEAYDVKEAFFDIWDMTDRREAEDAYDRLHATMPKSVRPYFRIVTTPMRNWRTEIFNFFDHRVTNGPTEAANSLIKAMVTAGRGYSYEVIRAKALFAAEGKQVAPFGKRIPKGWLLYSLPDQEETIAPLLNAGMDAGPELSTIEALFRGELNHDDSTEESE